LEINDSLFIKTLSLISHYSGITVPETNYSILRDCIIQQITTTAIDQYQYISYLQKNDDAVTELINAITIPETYLFREEKHFQILFSNLFYKLSSKQKDNFTLWSATCSTGAEAISLAAVANHFWNHINNKRFTVYGSDINTNSIQSFKKGILSKSAFREDGKQYHDLILSYCIEQGNRWIIDNDFLSTINIEHLNLYTDSLNEIPNNCDVIFLRNTMIYMTLEVRYIILEKLISKLDNGGYLFLSSSEITLISHHDLNLIEELGSYYFQKKTTEQKKIAQCIDYDFMDILKNQEKVNEEMHHDDLISKETNIQKEFNVLKVMTYANQKIFNKFFRVAKNVNYIYAIDCLECIFLFNSKELHQALVKMDEMTVISDDNEIMFFLQGYYHLVKNEGTKALSLFKESLNINDKFWPARFYRAKIYKEMGNNKSAGEIIKCINHIAYYIVDNSYLYQFLLDGFNARYFFDILTGWYDAIEGKSKE